MATLAKLVPSAALFLLGLGVQVSGYTNPNLALVLFALAGLLLIIPAWSLITRMWARRPRLFIAWDEHSQSGATALAATAYLRPPEKDELIIQWTSPIHDRKAAVVLDYRPGREQVRRLSLATDMALVEQQTVKTVVARRNEDGAWQWNAADNGLVHSGTVICRLTVMASAGRRFHWRFAIVDHERRQPLRIVGEDAFCYDFDQSIQPDLSRPGRL